MCRSNPSGGRIIPVSPCMGSIIIVPILFAISHRKCTKSLPVISTCHRNDTCLTSIFPCKFQSCFHCLRTTVAKKDLVKSRGRDGLRFSYEILSSVIIQGHVTYKKSFCLILDSINNSRVAMAYESNAVTSHAINIFLTKIIPYSSSQAMVYINRKSLIKAGSIMIFFVHVLLITVQLR